MGEVDSSFWGQGAKRGEARNVGAAGTSHLIRSAEKLASSGRFEFALEQLSVAQRLDPDNCYIQAITDRIRVTQNSVTPDALGQKQYCGPLAVTIDPYFRSGLKNNEGEKDPTPEDIPAKIRFLTNMAEQYLENGASEKAFESLMKAYLLDPLSPYVIASEKSVLPAWESIRGKQATRSANGSKESTENKSSIGTSNISPSNPFEKDTMSSPQSVDDQIRVDALRQKKDQERMEKERSVWREASKAPRVLDEDEHVDRSSIQETPFEQPKPHSAGLFSRLKLGKFLE